MLSMPNALECVIELFEMVRRGVLVHELRGGWFTGPICWQSALLELLVLVDCPAKDRDGVVG